MSNDVGRKIHKHNETKRQPFWGSALKGEDIFSKVN